MRHRDLNAPLGFFAVVFWASSVMADLPTTVEMPGGLHAVFRDSGLAELTIQPAEVAQPTRLLRAHYPIATVFGAAADREIPPLHASAVLPDGFAFGRCQDLTRGQPARLYTSYHTDSQHGVIFVRQRARMLAEVSISLEFQFRTEPRLFCRRYFSLPSGQELLHAEQPVYGPWILRHDRYDHSQGILFTDEQVFLAYTLLRGTPGDYWHARLPKHDPLYGEGPSDWGGILSPLWDICHGAFNVLDSDVPAGTEFLAEYCLHAGPWHGPDAVVRFLDSPSFATALDTARRSLDETEGRLFALENSWHRQTGTGDLRTEMEDTVVEAVRTQIDYQRMRGQLMDACIKAELQGRSSEAVAAPYEPRLSELEKLYARLPASVATLRAAVDQVGVAFSKTQDLTGAEALAREALVGTRTLVEVLAERVTSLSTRLTLEHGVTLREALRGPRSPGTGLLDRPLFGICWYYTNATGVDSARAELGKMRALGFSTVETSAHSMTVDRLHYALSQDRRWPEMEALLAPFRDSGLQVMLGTYSSLVAQTPEALEFLEVPYELYALPDYMAFKKPDYLDYENPQAVEFTEDVYRRIAEYLHRQWPDVVAGFDYNNEMGWMLNFSPHAKRSFVAYLRAKYGTVEQLGAAWGRDFASWEALDQAFDGVRDLEEHKLGPAAWAEWRRYGVLSYTRNFWGAVYRGLKSGWPTSSAVARDPRGAVLGLAEAHYPVTDIPDQHSYLWYMGSPPAAMQAEADGRPWMNSEFWWAYWHDPDKVAEYFDQEFARRYADRFGGGRSPAGEEVTRHTADTQFWNYFFHDCRGYLYFYWRSGGSCAMLQPNGLLRDSAAAQYHTMRQAEALTPLMARTRPDTRLAVFVPLANGFLSDASQGRLPQGAFLAMSVLNLPHTGITESQILRGDLSAYTHLWLHAAAALPASVAETIVSWVRDGGTLVCSGAAGITDELGNRHDFLAGIAGAYFGEWRRLGAEPDPLIFSDGWSLDLSDPDVNRPLSSMLEGYFSYPRREARNFSLEEIAPRASILATYASGAPAFVAQAAGRGRVLTLGPRLDFALYRAAVCYDSRGEEYLAHIVEALDRVVAAAGIERSIRLDRWGELSTSQQNVLAVLRHDPADPSRKYLFMLNAGRAFEGKVGDYHYAPVYHGTPTQVTCQLDLPVRSMRELLREVEVPLTRRPRSGVFTTTLQPGRPYVFELRLAQ